MYVCIPAPKVIVYSFAIQTPKIKKNSVKNLVAFISICQFYALRLKTGILSVVCFAGE